MYLFFSFVNCGFGVIAKKPFLTCDHKDLLLYFIPGISVLAFTFKCVSYFKQIFVCDMRHSFRFILVSGYPVLLAPFVEKILLPPWHPYQNQMTVLGWIIFGFSVVSLNYCLYLYWYHTAMMTINLQ